MNVTAAPASQGPLIVCENTEELYSPRGRAAVARAAADYLEENKLTALELLSSSEQARMVVNSDTLFGALVQRVAIAQAQALKQGVRDRVNKLTALLNGAVTQTQQFEKRLPPPPVDAAGLSKLVQSDPLYGERIAFAALTRHMAFTRGWTEKAERCFLLLGDPRRPTADAEALKIMDAALAEILLARTGVPELMGKARNPLHRIAQLLSLLDARFAMPAEEPVTELAEKLTQLMHGQTMPALRDAVLQLIRRLLDSSIPFVADEPNEEFRATRLVYETLTRDQALAVEIGVADRMEIRMKRLVTRENLARLIQGIYAGPKLMQALMLYEQTIGEGARDILLKFVQYMAEHRDLAKDFADPSTSQAEKLEMAEAIRDKLSTAGLPEHRREKLTELIDHLIGTIKAGEQRRSPRTMCGPEDHVLVESMKVPLKNWSALGLLFGPVSASLSTGEKLRLTVRIKNPKIQISFEAEAEVMRAAQDGMIAVKYVCHDRQIAKMIQHYFDPVGAAKG
ncbi:hypothetical protein [Ferrovibrio sp.]|uniref:hypothetical protein n=1 Tax=Ferrovibrio sp. TaxID=1917215 RepID=UPI003D13F965